MLTLRSLRAALSDLAENMRAAPALTAPTVPALPGHEALPEVGQADAKGQSGASAAHAPMTAEVTVETVDTLGAKTTAAAPARSRGRMPYAVVAALPRHAAAVVARVPHRDVIARAAGFWLATRIAYAFFTYFAVMFQHANPAGEFLPFGPSALLASWDRWDAVWYINIAQKGYWTQQAAAFFPLYPTLIKATSFFTFGNWVLAAMIASNLGTLLAFIGVALLAVQETRSRGVALRTLYLLAAFPLAFFLVAPYTEGFFIAFVALSFFCARRGSWVWAAVWAFCGALVRPTGAILLPALLWELGRQQGIWVALWLRLRALWAGRASGRALSWLAADRRQIGAWWGATRYRHGAWWRSGAWRRDAGVRAVAGLVAVVAAVPCAILVFMVILQVNFGHPLLWLHVQRIYWRRDGAPIWSAVSDAVGQVLDMPPWSYWQARELVDLAPVIVFGVITLLAARKMPFMFTIYMVGLIYVAVSTPVIDSPDPDLLISAGRFMLTAVPVFLVMGQWTRRKPNATAALLMGGFLVQAVLAAFFLAWGWLI